jgi:ribosomal-protein-alanine N-acetyltransferase
VSTPLVIVQPATADHLQALIAGPDTFARDYGLTVAEDYLEFDGALAYSLDQITDGGVDPGWMSFLFVEPDEGALIGFGGFKGAPVDGVVEIGYSVAPSHRGRGYATAAAGALIDRARVHGVEMVLAHTLAERNASTGVLAHLGFRRVDEIDDPDEGPVWRWELAVVP